MATSVTPRGILVTVALLAIYGAYGFWDAIVYRSFTSAVLGVLATVACVGTTRLLAWSRYLVYLLTAAFIAIWAQSLYAAAVAGYFSLFSPSQIALQLAPGIALVALSCSCAYVVFRHFRAVTQRR